MTLNKIPLRTVKDSIQRLIGSGNKIKGALKELEVKLKSIPREALSQWKKYAIKVREGRFLDNLRAQRLEKTLIQIPSRTIKDTIQRIFGNGNKIKGILK